MRYLISETTREEREQIVATSLGLLDGACDGCRAGLAEMYNAYIDGQMELREINQAFSAHYQKAYVQDEPERNISCPL